MNKLDWLLWEMSYWMITIFGVIGIALGLFLIAGLIWALTCAALSGFGITLTQCGR